jgi:hypothetical protein
VVVWCLDFQDLAEYSDNLSLSLRGIVLLFVNTKIWYRKESDLWAQLGEKIRSEEGRFLQKDSAK